MTNPNPKEITIREATACDIIALWQTLSVAAYEGSVSAARALPYVASHLKDWPGDGEFGFLAYDPDGAFLGAAWIRQLAPDEEPVFSAGERIPEISIAVMLEAVGRGVGTQLIAYLTEEADRRGTEMCVNLREDRHSFGLLVRYGFDLVPGSQHQNPDGSLSIGMIRRPAVSRTQINRA
ncbi:GNAT family N-acetyltransferase [Pseudooceanicola sp.]|uniref:GNAT family N-acetyltransferase n=1 Tax=Pseudooceanicola sp. TaxID=1914328 RepID=UPI002604B791|nr:GNAT family N-acetyltransferase [Pseudooceanicola sp.]MDF1857012.1 GNAT family N-acetyltransferase [Pseudooceanicola sp.]